jgi:hypothetical protein
VKLLSVHVSGELKTVDFQTENNVRNDLVGWLDTSSVHAQKLKPNFDLLRGVPAEIEKYSSLSFSVPALAQAALYNGSKEEPSSYHNHLDCGDPKTNPRRLTALLYLNPGFDAERDGGWLRAQLPKNGGVVDVEPKGGRLLLFNSCGRLLRQAQSCESFHGKKNEYWYIHNIYIYIYDIYIYICYLILGR